MTTGHKKYLSLFDKVLPLGMKKRQSTEARLEIGDEKFAVGAILKTNELGKCGTLHEGPRAKPWPNASQK
jgi:hypothetical protein